MLYEVITYRGEEAAALLLEKQLACIPLLKAKGITVKINFIIIPGIRITSYNVCYTKLLRNYRY